MAAAEPTASSSAAKQPISVLRTTPSAQLLVAACDTTLHALDVSTQTLLASKTAAHSSRIRLLAATNDKLVSTGDDKTLNVWSLPDLALLSSRALPKRANALKITEDAQTVAIGDKFGDVYSFPLDANQEIASTGVKEASDAATKPEKRLPILGHVSMLTDMTFWSSSPGGQTLITADRDEHIRISKWPNGVEIVSYLLGHLKFVSALCLLDQKLLSAGGEHELYIWDLQTMKLDSKRDISALRPFAKVPSPKRHQGLPPKGKKPADEAEAAPEEPKEYRDEHPIVVDHIFALSASWVGLTSTGCSAILALDLESDAQQIIDLKQPILSLDRLSPHQYIASLDLSRGKSLEIAVSCRVVSFRDGSFERSESSLASAVGALAVQDGAYPSSETLYPALSLLYKDQGEGDHNDKMMDSVAPRTHKPGGKPAAERKKGAKQNGKGNGGGKQQQQQAKRQKRT